MNCYIEGLVSVVIPMYDSASYITTTIQSVLSQTYKNIEVVVVDDCSKDDSVNVVKQIATKDARIRCIPLEKNQGAAVARNIGLKEAKGQFIAFLDSDDLWTENKLQEQLDFMKCRNSPFVFCAYDWIDENGTIINGKIQIQEIVTYKDLLTKTIISTPTVIYDRYFFGDIDMPPRRTGQDYAFWLVLLRKTDAWGIDKALVHVRRRKGSLSKNKFQNIKDIWEVQTINERINKVAATWHIFWYVLFAFKKRYL